MAQEDNSGSPMRWWLAAVIIPIVIALIEITPNLLDRWQTKPNPPPETSITSSAVSEKTSPNSLEVSQENPSVTITPKQQLTPNVAPNTENQDLALDDTSPLFKSCSTWLGDIETSICAEGLGFAPSSEQSPASREYLAILAAKATAKRNLTAMIEESSVESLIFVTNGIITRDELLIRLQGAVPPYTILAENYDPEHNVARVVLQLRLD